MQAICNQEAQGHQIFQMSSSSFPYNWDNVIHVINKIYSIINFKDSKCDQYIMDYISQSPIRCLKVNLKFVLKCTKFPGGNPMVICSRRTAHQLNTDTKNLVLVLTKKGGRISSHTQCLTTNYQPRHNN